MVTRSAWEFYSLNKSVCKLHSSKPHPKTKNCRDNPYCLERLGLEKWEKSLRSIENEGSLKKVTPSRRDIENVPCGLVNLGNSCYVNSFLQIFYNDPFFRKCIYEWKPVPDFVQPYNEQINIEELMLCLQKLFVTLQLTPLSAASAEDLVRLLKLDGDQQDALEFKILLFDTIERLLSYRKEWHSIKDAIRRRYQGVMRETITCECGRTSIQENPFHHLYLGIDKVHTLVMAIEKYLEPEELPDFKCDCCERIGSSKKEYCIKEVPSVLVIQLNRFAYDNLGNRKKLLTVLQYPRMLSLGGSVYQNCAVMVHTGQNADHGHYYDLIKHPGSEQWFTYDDKTVESSSAPGYVGGAKRLSKATNDVKGCYALIYRARDDEDGTIPAVPSFLAEIVGNKLEEDFNSKTNGLTAATSRLWGESSERYKLIAGLWTRLQVIQGHFLDPQNIAFLPTSLLVKILRYELKCAMGLNVKLDIPLNGEWLEMGFDEEILECFDQANNKRFHIRLCVHGNISPESVRSGEVKAVNRDAAEILLRIYSVQLYSASNIECRLRNGCDICEACIAELKLEEEFKSRLEAKEQLAKQLLRERNDRFRATNECVWVSVRSLSNYKRLAIGARGKRLKREAFELNFFASFGTSDYDILSKALSEYSQTEMSSCSVGDTGIDSSGKFHSKQTVTSSTETLSQFSASIPSNSKVGNSSVLNDKSDNLDRLNSNSSRFAAITAQKHEFSGPCADFPLKTSPMADRLHCHDPQVKGDHNQCDQCASTSHFPPQCSSTSLSRPKNVSNKVGSPLDTYALMTADDSPVWNVLMESDAIDEDCPDDSSIIFNGDLRCQHGKLDFQFAAMIEKRIAVRKSEWATLVNGMFDNSQLFQVPADYIPCAACECKKNDDEGRQRRIKEIQDVVGDLIRGIIRRKPSLAIDDHRLERVICKSFLKRAVASFRQNRNSDVPEFCQDCFLCEEHGMPYRKLNNENMVVPVTVEEWQKVVNAFEISAADATEVKIINGCFEFFCELCSQEELIRLDNQRFIYEDGAEIYVKLETDIACPPENLNDIGGSSNTIITSFHSPAKKLRSASNRFGAKSFMKFLLSSSNTIWDLKLKIYSQTGHSPSDQLIYFKDQPLTDTDTLEEIRIDPKELLKSPLTLIVQQAVAAPPRQLERGFAGTALSQL